MNLSTKHQHSSTSKRSIHQSGHSHIILPIVAVLIVAIIGVRLIVTHANPATVVTTTVTLVNADNNKTVKIDKGQKLVISLPNSAWIFAAVSKPSVLQFLSKVVAPVSSKYPSGNTTASYRAIGVGTSVISASATIRPVCTGHMACPQFIALARYQLTVDVINK